MGGLRARERGLGARVGGSVGVGNGLLIRGVAEAAPTRVVRDSERRFRATYGLTIR
jgi:hypothetical protein